MTRLAIEDLSTFWQPEVVGTKADQFEGRPPRDLGRRLREFYAAKLLTAASVPCNEQTLSAELTQDQIPA